MKGYRTILFNIGAAVLTVIVGANWTEVLAAVPWAPPLIVMAGNIALRWVTDTAVGQSK